MAEARVVIPYAPRREFMPYHDRGQRWSAIVAHRRAGKTVACINDLLRAALLCQLQEPRFAYIAPFYSQSKDVAWSYLKQFTSAIPGTTPHESELRVDLPNGGRIRLYGADNYERLRGVYFDGVILDEYGDMDPRAWSEVIRPALSDRKGWATFIGTPKGRNHFAEVWEHAQGRNDWYSLMLKASETNLLPPDELSDARLAMSEDQYAQEFECSFQAGVVGAYYGKSMQEAEAEGRITSVMWEKQLPVLTWWDLGIDDSTAIWFVQQAGNEVRLIDYYENSGVGLEHYAKVLQAKPYVYQERGHFLPHDVEVTELSTGKSRYAFLASLGLRGTVVPMTGVEDGINAVRRLLNRCWFDKVKCERGIEALRQYKREWDEKLKAFRQKPRHDWASHSADAFRYGAISLRELPKFVSAATASGVYDVLDGPPSMTKAQPTIRPYQDWAPDVTRKTVEETGYDPFQ